MMTTTITTTIDIALPGHDVGVREVAALSARTAYVLMCFTLCWGIFTATGWIRRLTGYQAIRSGHMILASFTIAAGMTHAIVFLLLREQGLSLVGIAIPFSGFFRHTLGILGLEMMIAIAMGVAVKRFVNYRRWLRFHQLAYPAIGMLVAHSWFGAIANGHLSTLWLGGFTVLVPAVTLTILRMLPPRLLIRAGLLGAAPVAASPVQEPSGVHNGVIRPVRVAVDNQRCKRYGFCQMESPELFTLLEDGRLRYVRDPDDESRAGAQAAARACPMRAIQLQEVGSR